MWVEHIAKVENAARLSLNIKPGERRLADELARRQEVSKTTAIHEVLSERSVALDMPGRSIPAATRDQWLLRAWHSDDRCLRDRLHRNEPDTARMQRLVGAGPVRLVSATCVLVVRMVLVAGAEHALAETRLWLARIEVDVVAVDADLIDLATKAGSPIVRAVIRRR